MTQTTSNVNTTTDSFQIWVNKTNELRYALQAFIVTANTTLGNTSGNCHISGFLAANTLVACANLQGGIISANGSGLPEVFSANLNITSNTVFKANVFINTGTTTTDAGVGIHSNTHTFNANLVASGTHFVIGTATQLSANGSVGIAGQVLTSNASTAYWRTLNDYAGLDSVVSTSVTQVAFANSVKTAYDAAVDPTIDFVRTYNANLVANGTHFIVSAATKIVANGAVGSANLVLTSNSIGGVYWGAGGGGAAINIEDSVTSTSVANAAAANSAKRAYDTAIVANNNAATADTKALAANTRAASAQTAASTAGTDAINANTRAFSAQTAAIAAYSNATTFSANATNLTNGIVPAARLSGTYTITATTASEVAWTGVTGRPTDLASFTNGPGYVTSSGSVAYATSSGTATTASSIAFASVTGTSALLRHVTTGYTGSGRVFVSSSTPSTPVQGDIWLQI